MDCSRCTSPARVLYAERNTLAFSVSRGNRRFIRRRREATVIRPASDFAASEFKEHEGEEFLFVHRGKVEIDFASQRITLTVGDAIYFNAQIPHRIRSLGTQKAEVLLVISSAAEAL